MVRTCDTCDFWHGPSSQCRYESPNEIQGGQWTTVDPKDWCGRFQLMTSMAAGYRIPDAPQPTK